MPLRDAQESFAAAVAFRSALLRMREVIGNDTATASACLIQADILLDGKFLGSTLSQKEISELVPALNRASSVLEKIQAILGDRVMQCTEVYRALVSSGEPETIYLRNETSHDLAAHCNGRGRMLFTRVRHGWYKNRGPGDAVVPVKLTKGLFIRVIYDVMGTNGLTIGQITDRCVNSGKLPVSHCGRPKVSAALSNNSERGVRCFERISEARYRRIPRRRPEVEVPLNVTLDALSSILARGPLLFGVIYERFCERRPLAPFSPKRLKQVLLGNSRSSGQRLFYKLTRHIWGLNAPDVLQLIMKAMNDGEVLTPKQVQVRIEDGMGQTLDTSKVSYVMRRNSGTGAPLVRYRNGLYGRKT